MKKEFKRKAKNFFITGRAYKSELRFELRYLILFTLGFTIAFTWREYSFESSMKLMKWITGTSGSGAFGGALFITIVCLILAFLTAQYFKKDYRGYYKA